MKKKTNTDECSICGLSMTARAKHKAWTLGNNADPVNDGRCCDFCNDTVVLPARINHIAMTRGVSV